MKPDVTTRTAMSMPMVMMAIVNAARPTMGRIASRSMTIPMTAVASAAAVSDTKNTRKPAIAPTRAGAT